MPKLALDESRSTKDVTIKADPIEVDLDPVELGKGPAEAIAKAIGDGIRGCDLPAKPGTIKRRQAQGITSQNKWNATGRLAESIAAARDGDGYVIGVGAADRLQDPQMLAELARDIPEIRDPVTPEVEQAIEKTAESIVTVRRR